MRFKLTSSQMNFYNKNFTLDSQIWNQGVMEIFPKVYSYEEINNAYNKLVEIHDSLRVKLVETENGVVADVKEHEYINYRFWQVETEEELMEKAQDFLNEPTDRYGLLVDCAIFHTPTTSGIMINAHHIVVDGYSVIVMAEHMNELLKDLNFSPVIQKYSDYVEAEEKHKQSRRFEKAKDFWLKEFSNKPDCNIFTAKDNTLDYLSNEVNSVIPKDLFDAVSRFCQENEISVTSFFNTIYGIYFSRMYETTSFTMGVPVLNRITQSEFNTIGLYMHVLPMVCNIVGDASFLHNAKQIEDSQMNLLRHQKFTQTDIKEALETIDYESNNLFSIATDYQSFTTKNEYEILIKYANYLATPLEIHLQSFNDTLHKFKIRYRTSYFNEQEIEIMLKSIVALVEDAVENPGKCINKLEMISDDEKQKLLNDFNNTTVDYVKDKYIHTLFEEQAEKTPDKIALVACDKTLTYRELNEEANRLANSLMGRGIGKGDIVGIKLSRTSKFLISVLGILKTGAAYLPFDITHPQERIDQILFDSDAKLCITEENFNELLDNLYTENPDIKISGNALCYCIYTSGSTGIPKGAMIQHKNLCWYMSALMSIYGTEPINMPFFTSTSVDLSIPSYFLPLMTGGTTYFYDNDLARDLSDIIDNEEINTIKVTPTHLQIILQHIKGKTLHNIKYLISGGESLRYSNCVEFLEKFGKHIEIHNEYGPTETTVSCVDYLFSLNDTDDIVSIGAPIDNAQIFIVDKHTNLLPIGVTGELCIAGDGVCAGYLNNPELTAEKFIDNPFGEGKLYKTGDLAYWREDGNIVFVGRKDFQVKIRGLRIELGEIESVLQAVKGVESAVVAVRKDKKERQLICAFYTGEELDVKELRMQLSVTLPKYMVPHTFTHLEQMPMTASGKASRNDLPEIDLDNISTEAEYVAPQTFEEEILTVATETVLDIEKVGVLDNFFDLGGDSLKSIELVSEIEDKGYTVNIKAIFEAKDIQNLAKKLTVKEEKNESVQYSSVLPATAAQMSVYTPQMMNANSTLYNIPCIFKVKELDVTKLEDSINKLIARHEGLRTSFENRNGEIVQIINDTAAISIEELKNDNPEEFIRPFDLSIFPLLRVGYYKNTVMVDMHHIIADGSTVAIFYRELNEMYMGRELPSTVQYAEFAVTSKYTEEDKQYWLNEYKDIPALELYTDYPKSEIRSVAGSRIYERINIETHNKIIEKCRELNITPYVYYMACYNILLSKYSGNEDISVGVPSSGRSSKYLNSWGMLVNMLSLRTQPTGTKDFKTFVNEVKKKSIEAISHQNYPQQELIKNTNSKKTLFDVMFIYQSEEMTKPVLGDKKAELIPVYGNTARCDLCFQLLPRENETVLMAEYCTDLFKEETINKFLNGYISILNSSLNEETLIKDISVLSEEERETILKEFNNTTAEYAREKCIHELFEEQVERTPDKVAVVASDK
ncbi:MAG: amino acid adenylation domain-containing protein, partial [Clostridia bacterium]|nr:amino acid adenylation domain-containing protein [Clostridia bacterium]